jgi:hypothetical protein
MGVGEPKLLAKHTVEKHYHLPLRGFRRVAAAGSSPERTGCAGFVIISRNPRSALFLLWGITPTRQNPRSQCSTVCILLMKQFLPECHLQFFSISAFPCSEFWSLLGPCRFVHKIPDIRSQKPRPWLCLSPWPLAARDTPALTNLLSLPTIGAAHLSARTCSTPSKQFP